MKNHTHALDLLNVCIIIIMIITTAGAPDRQLQTIESRPFSFQANMDTDRQCSADTIHNSHDETLASRITHIPLQYTYWCCYYTAMQASTINGGVAPTTKSCGATPPTP